MASLESAVTSTDWKVSAVAGRKISETQALNEAQSRILREKDEPTAQKPPKRLYDIQLGELTEETTNKPFVIVSYVWNPQELPRFPRLGSYSTEHFDAMVLAASKLQDEQGQPILEFDPRVDQKMEYVALPVFRGYTSLNQHQYLQEVFALVAAEATDRGLRYIWMDSLCIEQDNDIDKALEIRHMADFYSQAVCCVVISEMLRRRYAHSWEKRGGDDTYKHKSPVGFPEARVSYREAWGLHDEVLGWIIGYHELRVWVFQETYYAKELVHRGGNIRINTSVCLDWNRSADANIAPLGRPWHKQSADEKATVLKKMRLQYLQHVSSRFPTAFDQKDSAENIRQIDRILQGVLSQRRSVTKPQDAVYGLLSLYPRLIRFSIPIHYNISRLAVVAILTYLRVHSGEVGALLFCDGHPELGSHEIENAPSWLPRGMPVTLTDTRDVYSLCSMSVDLYNNLVVQAEHVPLVGAKWASKENKTGQESIDDSTSEYDKTKDDLWLLPRSISGLRKWHFWCPYLSDRPSADKRRSSEANEIIRGVDNDATIMAKLGITDLPDGREIILWMVLVGVQGRETYLKRGWVYSGDELIPDTDTSMGTLIIQ